MPFDLPENQQSIIKVVGVGGGGSNAVNHMFRQGIQDVNFMVCNTDSQALENSPVPVRIQLGSHLTEGRGAGNKPERGREAAKENIDDVIKCLGTNTKMVFITAGMGGGTGTGAAPVIAEATKKLGILTVGIVTMPFGFEGKKRVNQAIEGIKALNQHVDSLLVIHNEKLREIYGDLKVSAAFNKADDVLTVAAKGIAEIITVSGYINVDFADVQTVMTDSGVALMGQGKAGGEKRAIRAIEAALNSPLLNNNDIRGAKNILLNITSGTEEATMDEIGEINDYVQEASGSNADLIWGNTKDDSLGDKICVTVIATGFQNEIIPELASPRSEKKTMTLKDSKSARSKPDFFEVIRPREETVDYNEGHRPGRDVVKLDEGLANLFAMDDDDVVADSAREAVREIERGQQEKLNRGRQEALYRDNIEEMENIPAYRRKNISNSEGTPSSQDDSSRMSISRDGSRPRLRDDNSFLHDRPD